MPDINVNIALDEPAVAANLNQLRYLVFEGKKGYSPTVTVTDITGGHRVTITDEDGAHTFDVMDGGFQTAVYGSTTASEIRAWINNGEPVRCVYDGREYWCSSVVQSGASSYRAVFACCDSALSGLTRTYKLHILDAGDTTPPTWTHYVVDLGPELPAVSASDNGKVLGVVNGAWAKVTPPEGALIIDWNNKYANAYNDAKAAMQADREVYLKIPNAASDPTQCTYLRANAWDNTYIVFGGFTSAYLPGEVFIFTYAHITDGLDNWFKWTTNFYYNPALLKHLAPAYDSTATYSVGDYVTYGEDASQTSSVYKCTTAINTPENWNSAHWTAVTVMDEVATSGGGSAPFVIPVTESGGAYSTTATAADIVANYDNCVMTLDGTTYQPTAYGLVGSSDAQIVFGATDAMQGYISNATIVITAYNGAVTVQGFEADARPELPPVTSADDGKVLKVVDGVWTAVAE